MGHVLRFSRPAPEARDWRNDELAELYRVENSLLQAGVSVSTARGVTDEGDPWFVFCGANHEPIVHIARYDGAYHIHAAALNEGLRGQSFTEITKSFINRLPMQMGKGVTLHPSALFGLMVATLFFAIDHKPAQAAEKGHAPAPPASLVNTLKHYVRALAGEGGTAYATEGELEAVTQLIAVAASVGGLAQAAAAGGASHIGVAPDAAPTATVVAPETLAAHAVSSAAPGAQDFAQRGEVGAGAPTPQAGAQGAASAVAVTLAAPMSSPGGPNLSARPAGAPAAVAAPTIAGAVVVPHQEPDATVVIANSGALALTEDLANGAFRIAVARDAHVSLDLNLVYAKGATTGDATLTLGGHASVDLNDLTALSASPAVPFGGVGAASAPAVADVATAHVAPHLNLTVASAGGEANTLTLAGGIGAGVNLAIHVTGSQNLQLNESASNLSGVSVDSTQFQGALTIGVDLSSVSGAATLIGQSNFVVGENASLALLNVNDHATVQFGINLASAIVQMSAGADALDLQLAAPDAATSGVSVTSLSANSVTDLVIESLGGASKGNTLDSVYANALSHLAIAGDAPLAIDAFVAAAGATQPMTIDASAFKAHLHIDVTGISGSPGLTIKLGAAGAEVMDLNASAPLTIVGGGGADTIELAPGGTQTVVVNLGASQNIFVGAGAIVDATIDATHPAAISQSALDAMSLVDAAEAAAAAAGGAGQHQAVLFLHGGNAFVFVDALGNHTFNAAVDAIVGLVGAPAIAELSGQFHSF